jgi:hypothetical protein
MYVSLLIFLLISILPVFKVSAASTTIAVNPPSSYVTVGATFSVDVNVTNVANLTSWQIYLYFLNSVLNCTNVTEGPFLKTVNGTFFGYDVLNNYNATYGRVLVYCTLLGSSTANGSGVLTTITFGALSVGDTALHLSETKLGNEKIPPQPIDHTTIDGTVHVQSTSLTVYTVGSGAVTLNNSGPYHYGDVVQLTAVANIYWSFSYWSGDLTGSANPVALTVTGNMVVTATFVQVSYTLTVNVVGSGVVNLNNTGPFYHYGDVVLLTAAPSAGWSFQSWSGNLVGSANPATLVIIGNMTVTATFTSTDQYFLLTTVIGNGFITRVPNQITYSYGTIVTLTAFPDAGWIFAGWSGAVSDTSNPITVNMTSNKAVNATFIRNVFILVVSVVPSDGGSVSLNNSGPYHYGDSILLWAVPYTDWFFQYWSGGLSGSVNPATLIITGNFSVTAHFNVSSITLQMSPVGKTCRIHGENFTVGINIANATLVTGFSFEIHYNTTLLAYSGVIWNAWSSGTINVDEAIGNITGFTSGAPINGTQTLISLKFQTCFYHVWKNASNWTNDLTDTTFFQSASVYLSSGSELRYQRGGQHQISVGPDFAYTFSPIQGDVNNDGTVDIYDLRPVGAYFNAKQGDPNWTEASTYDLNGDGTIDTLDLRSVEANYDYTYLP